MIWTIRWSFVAERRDLLALPMPTAERLDRDYLAKGTDSLRRFAKLRRVNGASIAAALDKHPEIYVGARRCMSALPAVEQRRLLSQLSNPSLPTLCPPRANFIPWTLLKFPLLRRMDGL